jgi:hypothetical protein
MSDTEVRSNARADLLPLARRANGGSYLALRNGSGLKPIYRKHSSAYRVCTCDPRAAPVLNADEALVRGVDGTTAVGRTAAAEDAPAAFADDFLYSRALCRGALRSPKTCRAAAQGGAQGVCRARRGAGARRDEGEEDEAEEWGEGELSSASHGKRWDGEAARKDCCC